MTVGAVVLPGSPEEALADAGGRIAVRRIVDSAWAGGAMPIIVAVADGDGRVATALEGSPAAVVDPLGSSGAAACLVGVQAAIAAVKETSALLLWPGRMTWTDPETVTSLIEAHGRDGGPVVRPGRAGRPGWPVLVPADSALRLLAEVSATLEEVLDGVAATTVELGDPGSVLGFDVRLEDLPDYAGPPEPVGGPPPEWGAAAAESADPEVPREP